MNACENAGYPLRIVGGAVRDALLGRVIHDIDMAIAATPQHVIKILSPLCTVIPTGLSHGTITAVFKENCFQITSLRADEKTSGRHADVRFHTSFEEDAKRRDFTMNALYVDHYGKLYDYVGGIDDLSHERVRFIGCPKRRIKEDYLRILRFFRMHAYFGKEIDQKSLEACAKAAPFLKTLSRERIRSEFFRILTSEKATEIVQLMNDHRILCHLFFVQPPCLNINPLQTYTALNEKDNSNDKIVAEFLFLKDNTAHKAEKTLTFLKKISTVKALIKLFLLIPKNPLEDTKKLYVLTRKEQKIYAILQKECAENFFINCTTFGSSQRQFKEILALWSFYYGKEEAKELLLIALSLNNTMSADAIDAFWDNGKKLLRLLAPLPLPINAHDLMGHGVPQHQLSAAIKLLEQKWCASSFTETTQELLLQLGSIIK